MIEILRRIILDNQVLEWPTGIARHLNLEVLPGKAAVCIGVRRSGKSTYLFQWIRRLQAAGVPAENILYLNFFDDRLRGLRDPGPGIVLDAYFSLYPEKKSSETVYCFFDEIQELPGWEAFIDRILRTEDCRVFLTGSSARLLSREIATQLRGRSLAWEMFPFSFREFLDWKGLDADAPRTTKQVLLLQAAWEEYRQCGGFPEVLGLKSGLRVRIHQEYFHAVLFRDLVERHDVSHPRALMDLAHWLLDHTGSLYSLNRLTAYLQGLGHKVPKASVGDYLDWLEDAYFLFTVRLYDSSPTRVNANPKKIYCIDHALIASVASGTLLNSGHHLENMVFLALRRHSTDIRYFKDRDGREVDFVLRGADRSLKLIQVCETLSDPQVRERETRGLESAWTALGDASAFIVTREDEGEITTASGRIRILPAWRFLLGEEWQ